MDEALRKGLTSDSGEACHRSHGDRDLRVLGTPPGSTRLSRSAFPSKCGVQVSAIANQQLSPESSLGNGACLLRDEDVPMSLVCLAMKPSGRRRPKCLATAGFPVSSVNLKYRYELHQYAIKGAPAHLKGGASEGVQAL